MNEKIEPEKLEDIVKHIEEEARMVLPGIQALFGFQLIAVFNSDFRTVLEPSEQKIHLAALACSAIAATLTIAPAAYHRQAEPEGISQHFARLASRFLCWALIPLALGVCTDFYLICRIILKDLILSGGLAAALLSLMIYLWFIYPHLHRKMN